MNILIIGGGLLGRKTAELLDAAGHDVAVIDESAENIAQLNSQFGGFTTVGFPMDTNSLRNAGIESCDAVAVTTADDNLNIAVGQIVKNFFGVPRVVARISDPYREGIFERFGLQTVCPTNMAGEKLASALTSPRQGWQVTFGTSTVALQLRPLEKKYIGRTTADWEPAPGDGLFGVIREDGDFVLQTKNEAIPLKAGDTLVCSRQID